MMNIEPSIDGSFCYVENFEIGYVECGKCGKVGGDVDNNLQ